MSQEELQNLPSDFLEIESQLLNSREIDELGYRPIIDSWQRQEKYEDFKHSISNQPITELSKFAIKLLRHPWFFCNDLLVKILDEILIQVRIIR
jgi:hypothetical protein